VTLFVPDVSNNNWNNYAELYAFLNSLAPEGFSGVIHKMSEGASFVDQYGALCQVWAAKHSFPFIGYHFATTDPPFQQMNNWHLAGGGHNVMIDFEQMLNDEPTLTPQNFWDLVDAFSAANVKVALAYIPGWYASRISMDLTNLAGRGIAWIQSAYPRLDTGTASSIYAACGGDQGVGWTPYGATATIWQFTDRASIGNISADCNAYQGNSQQLKDLFGDY
jgi:Glycosyl hydrolases family 25